MSSPGASLKKNKKPPMFPGAMASSSNKKNVPFRSPGYTEEESLLLDQITSNMATSRLSQTRHLVDPLSGGVPANKPEHVITHRPAKTAPNDHELMALMMSRLASLEGRLQFQAKEMSEKDKKIKILQEKVSLLQKSRENAAGGSSAQELEKKCVLLQQQIHDMEDFLADYGMVWVGETADRESDVYVDEPIDLPPCNDMWKPEESVAGDREEEEGEDDEFRVDYDRVLQNIEDLNALAGEGVGQVQHNADGARIKMPETIPLTLYQNGLVMFSGPFRPYDDPETRQCMQDIMDGYFPSELQQRYPDGVPFFVTDKRTVYFKDKTSEIFKGLGQPLGGEKKPSRLVPSRLQANTKTTGTVTDSQLQHTAAEHKHTATEVETELPGRKLSMEQYLNRLPQNVIKQGKVIDIRNSVGQAIQGSEGASKVTVVETEAMNEMKERLALEEQHRPPTGKFTTLRIKDEKGDTFILKMRFTDTVGNVRQHLTKHRPRTAAPYSIVSSFPTKYYEDFYATLEDCGLVPNATLYLKPSRKS